MNEDKCEFNDGNDIAYHIHQVEPTSRRRDSWFVCKENFKDHCEAIQPS